jgi:glycosyltransferase involved in cell wall biosynthesis
MFTVKRDAPRTPTSRLRLTVITPSLNQVAYLERAVRSVLDQGYPALEYIVVDGGSTDGSADLLRRYDDRLAYWVSEPDAGQSNAINKGLARATGDVVAYINSDDYYLPDAFASALRAFAADKNVRWVAGTCKYLRPDGTVDAIWRPQPPVRPRERLIRERWYVPQASSFWRRDVFDELGPLRDDLHYVFDNEFGLRLALAGVLPRIVDAPLAVRFLQGEAKSVDTAPFRAEYERLARELLAGLTTADHVLYRAWRALYVLGLGQFALRRRLGLLHLRERLRGSG